MSEFRRRLLMQSKSELPSGYTRLAYIESTDSSWINTNIYCNNTIWQLDIKGTNFLSSTAQVAMCSNNIAGGWIGVLGGSQKYVIAQNNYFNVNWFERVLITAKFESIITTFIIGNEIKNINRGLNKEVYLGAGNIYSIKLFAKIYSFVGTDLDGNLLFNGIPAIDSDGNVGLFDTITQQLFTSQNKQQFIAGYE